MTSRFIVFYAGVLMSLSAMSIDILLPALPEMARAFQSDVTLVQWTITIFIAGLGLGQMPFGLLADHAGRRAALAWGLGLYAIATMSALLATRIDLVLLARFVQGIGAASATVTARAMLRDVFSGSELAKAMSMATSVFAIGPIVAPLLGSLLLFVAGWQAIFIGLALICVALLSGRLLLAETLAPENRVHLSFSGPAVAIGAVWRHPQSRFFLLLGPVASSPMILILAMLPPIYAEHFAIEGFGFARLFALHGLGIIVGQAVNRRLISSAGTERALLAGAAVLVLASSGIIGVAAFGLATPFSMTALIILFATSYLIVVANALSLLLEPHGKRAGSAVAVSTTMQQIGSGLIATALVAVLPVTPMALGLALFATCLATLLCALYWAVVTGRLFAA